MEKKYKKKIKQGHRLFVAIKPPREIRAQIRDIQRHLAKYAYKFRFVNIEQTHLTLKFLGNDVATQSADQITSSLLQRSSLLNVQYLSTESIKFGFEKRTDPKVIHMSVTLNEKLKNLIHTIQDIAKREELPDIISRKDSQKHLAHITIARVKKDIGKRQIKEIRSLLDEFDFSPTKFKVEELQIIESKLTKKGPVYSVYSRIPF